MESFSEYLYYRLYITAIKYLCKQHDSDHHALSMVLIIYSVIFTDFLRGFIAQSTHYCMAITNTSKDEKTYKESLVFMTSLILRALIIRNANVFNEIFLDRSVATFQTFTSAL